MSPGSRKTSGVRLRPAEARDCRQVWVWRNDVDTRHASFNTAPVDWDTHVGWFAEALASRVRKVYVVVAGGRDAGVVRVDVDGGTGTVSINIAPDRRGRGLGIAALHSLADLASDELGLSELIAWVKPDNHSSLSAFAKAGYTVTETGAVVKLKRAVPARDGGRARSRADAERGS